MPEAAGQQAAKVVIIDDSRTSLEALRAILQKAGHTVIGFDRALGAAQGILRERPDLILLDVAMPGLSGDQLVQVLRENPTTQQCVIVLHSSKSPRELQQLVDACGADGYICKGGDPVYLTSQINTWIRRIRR